MEYNLLDRIMDEDYYGPGSAEFLLRGMSPEGQKKFIKDVSKRIARRISTGSSRSEKLLDERVIANDLEKAVNRLPEEMQDSRLISASKPKTVFLDDGIGVFGKTSDFNPEENRVTIRRSLSRDPKSSVLHEVGHHADYNMSKKRPLDGKMVRVPASMFNGLGGDIREEALDEVIYPNKSKILDKTAYPLDERFITLNADLQEYLKKKKPVGKTDTEVAVGSAMMDWFGLGNETDIGRDPAYRTGKQIYGLTLKTGNSEMRPWDVMRNMPPPAAAKLMKFSLDAPIALEGPSNIYEILGEEGGAEWMRQNMPKAYAKMEKMAKEDIRKGKFVPPSEKYADELGMSLLKERKEKALARKQKVLDRYRAEFMKLPEDKRNYYESAKPGDVLWFKSPDFPEGENHYSLIKGDPRYVFRGSKLQRVRSDLENHKGRFAKRTYYTDLNELAPDFVPTDDFDISNSAYESKKVLERLERAKKRRH